MVSAKPLNNTIADRRKRMCDCPLSPLLLRPSSLASTAPYLQPPSTTYGAGATDINDHGVIVGFFDSKPWVLLNTLTRTHSARLPGNAQNTGTSKHSYALQTRAHAQAPPVSRVRERIRRTAFPSGCGRAREDVQIDDAGDGVLAFAVWTLPNSMSARVRLTHAARLRHRSRRIPTRASAGDTPDLGVDAVNDTIVVNAAIGRGPIESASSHDWSRFRIGAIPTSACKLMQHCSLPRYAVEFELKDGTKAKTTAGTRRTVKRACVAIEIDPHRYGSV